MLQDAKKPYLGELTIVCPKCKKTNIIPIDDEFTTKFTIFCCDSCKEILFTTSPKGSLEEGTWSNPQ